ncbi:hypothetical protein [Tautonia marina]|uniref:hypothetical protein n=1 Tax=Tautonia marina TaxID=2653855 RepID=UPI0012610373|nr:hypothetical protein [Tautonia marina]
MWGTLHQRVEALGTWPNVALLLVAFLVCLQGFDWRQEWLEPTPQIPDARPGYTPEELREVFEVWGQAKRQRYAITQVTLDGIFPLVYGLLFAICVAQLFTGKRVRWLVVVPMLAMLADLVENMLLALLAWNDQDDASPLAWIAAASTLAKFSFFSASLILLVVGGIAGRRRSMTSA